MKRIILILTSFLLLLTAMACSLSMFDNERGSGVVVTEVREISNVTEVSVEGSGTLHLTQGDAVSLSVEAEDNLLKNITTQVVGDRLYIKQESNWFFSFLPTEPIHYYLTLPSVSLVDAAGSANVVINKLDVDDLKISLSGSSDLNAGTLETAAFRLSGSGSADVVIETLTSTALTGNFSGSSDVIITSLHADSFDVKASGSLKLKMESAVMDWFTMGFSGSANIEVNDLTAETVELKSSGSADVILAGEVTNQALNMSGSGSYKAGDLKSATAVVESSGSTDVKLWVTGELTLDLSGSSDIGYYGSPAITQSNGGSATIQSLGDKE